MAALDAPTMDFSGSPNAAVYAEDAGAAQDAYNQAQTNIAAKRNQLNTQAGFKADGSVDGLNLTGQYQQLQKSEGMNLEGQHEADMARGIGGAGIGAQNTSNMRYGNAVEQANFGTSFLNANQGLADAGTQAFGTYQQSLLNLQLQAISDARAAQQYPVIPGSGGGSSGSGSGDGGGGISTPDYLQSLVGQTMANQVNQAPGGASSGAGGVLTGLSTVNNEANKNAKDPIGAYVPPPKPKAPPKTNPNSGQVKKNTGPGKNN